MILISIRKSTFQLFISFMTYIILDYKNQKLSSSTTKNEIYQIKFQNYFKLLTDNLHFIIA